MIPNNFDYHRASSVDEAVSLLKEFGAAARLLAGGHSLLPAMKLRLDAPSKLIDIGKIPELRYIGEDGDTIVIGAAATHYTIESSDVVKSKAPLLSQTAAAIGDVQVRNMGTIGGSLAHADPAADWPASILATEAKIIIKGPNGQRMIDASDFCTGLFTTALQAGEIITEIRVPAHPGNTGASYMKFAQPASRFAIMGCAALVTKKGNICERVRVAFSGAADHAFRDTAVENALTGKAPDEANIAAAAEKAAEGMELLHDHFASENYRRHLAKVYAKRALIEASTR